MEVEYPEECRARTKGNKRIDKEGQGEGVTYAVWIS